MLSLFSLSFLLPWAAAYCQPGMEGAYCFFNVRYTCVDGEDRLVTSCALGCVGGVCREPPPTPFPTPDETIPLPVVAIIIGSVVLAVGLVVLFGYREWRQRRLIHP